MIKAAVRTVPTAYSRRSGTGTVGGRAAGREGGGAATDVAPGLVPITVRG